MKKFVKLTLAVALLFIGASAANAQQFGRVDLTAIIPNMPEYQEADKNLAEYGKDLQDQLEQMQVEFNQKLADYQKNANTYSDAIRQTKESELQQLDQRLREFQQIAYQDLQKKQNELMAPIIEKANNAVMPWLRRVATSLSSTPRATWQPQQGSLTSTLSSSQTSLRLLPRSLA